MSDKELAEILKLLKSINTTLEKIEGGLPSNNAWESPETYLRELTQVLNRIDDNIVDIAIDVKYGN